MACRIFRRALLLGAACLLAGCDALDRRAMVMVLDETYAPEVLLANKNGIVSPDGLLWHDGRLVIADEGGSAVRTWTPGKGLQRLASRDDGLRSPEDLAFGPGGVLHVTDDTAGGLWRFDKGGPARRLPDVAPLRASEGLTSARSGALAVGGGESGYLVFVAPDGDHASIDLHIAKAESLAYDGSGNLYIADNRDDVLYLLTKDGRLHRPIAGRDGFSPESIHFADGALLITDSHNGKLYCYSPEDGLETIAVFAGELANVQGVTTDPGGNIYVSVQSDLKAGRGFVLRLRRRAS